MGVTDSRKIEGGRKGTAAQYQTKRKIFQIQRKKKIGLVGVLNGKGKSRG